MSEHLSDLCALEWARFGENRLLREDPGEVSAHLLDCAACRKKVEDFRELERKMHPYGEPLPPDRRAVLFRRFLWVAGTALLLSAAAWLLLLSR